MHVHYPPVKAQGYGLVSLLVQHWTMTTLVCPSLPGHGQVSVMHPKGHPNQGRLHVGSNLSTTMSAMCITMKRILIAHLFQTSKFIPWTFWQCSGVLNSVALRVLGTNQLSIGCKCGHIYTLFFVFSHIGTFRFTCKQPLTSSDGLISLEIKTPELLFANMVSNNMAYIHHNMSVLPQQKDPGLAYRYMYFQFSLRQ